ncbi:MAG: hypothetical protein ACRDLB_06810 [Actinomycetota bacterium]
MSDVLHRSRIAQATQHVTKRVGTMRSGSSGPGASDVVVAGSIAAALSGAPSSIHSLATGRSLLASAAAAGSLVMDEEDRVGRLVAAAVPVHLGLSFFWATAIGMVLPERRPVTTGALLGLGIGLLDMVVIGRRFPRIRALPLMPQLADHMLFGALVALVLGRRRSAPGRPGSSTRERVGRV